MQEFAAFLINDIMNQIAAEANVDFKLLHFVLNTPDLQLNAINLNRILLGNRTLLHFVLLKAEWSLALLLLDHHANPTVGIPLLPMLQDEREHLFYLLWCNLNKNIRLEPYIKKIKMLDNLINRVLKYNSKNKPTVPSLQQPSIIKKPQSATPKNHHFFYDFNFLLNILEPMLDDRSLNSLVRTSKFFYTNLNKSMVHREFENSIKTIKPKKLIELFEHGYFPPTNIFLNININILFLILLGKNKAKIIESVLHHFPYSLGNLICVLDFIKEKIKSNSYAITYYGELLKLNRTTFSLCVLFNPNIVHEKDGWGYGIFDYLIRHRYVNGTDLDFYYQELCQVAEPNFSEVNYLGNTLLERSVEFLTEFSTYHFSYLIAKAAEKHKAGLFGFNSLIRNDKFMKSISYRLHDLKFSKLSISRVFACAINYLEALYNNRSESKINEYLEELLRQLSIPKPVRLFQSLRQSIYAQSSGLGIAPSTGSTKYNIKIEDKNIPSEFKSTRPPKPNIPKPTVQRSSLEFWKLNPDKISNQKLTFSSSSTTTVHNIVDEASYGPS